MTSISYEDIFSDFLGNITDYTLTSLNTSEVYELMSEYLHKTLSQSHVVALFSEFKLNDEVQTFSYDLEEKRNNEIDKYFVVNVLSKGMIIEWLRPQVISKTNIAQMIGTKETKWFSQSSHLSELRRLLDDAKIELEKMIRDRGYIYNSYLGVE